MKLYFPSQEELETRERIAYRLVLEDGTIIKDWWRGRARYIGEGFTSPAFREDWPSISKDHQWVVTRIESFEKGSDDYYREVTHHLYIAKSLPASTPILFKRKKKVLRLGF